MTALIFFSASTPAEVVASQFGYCFRLLYSPEEPVQDPHNGSVQKVEILFTTRNHKSVLAMGQGNATPYRRSQCRPSGVGFLFHITPIPESITVTTLNHSEYGICINSVVS